MVSQSFINECKNPAYKNRLGQVLIGKELIYLTIDNTLKIGNNLKISNIPTNLERSSASLNEITIKDSCYSNGNIIGNVISKEAEIKINDIRSCLDDNFVVECGVKLEDGQTEFINLGTFLTESQKINKTENNSTLIGLDYFSKLNEAYYTNIENWDNITIKDLLIDLCNSMGLNLITESFINDDLIVKGNNYQNNYKFRDVLSDICEIACCWAEIVNENDLCLNWFDDEVSDVLDKSQYSTLEKNSFYGKVNSVVIKDSSFKGENTIIEDIESIEIDGENQVAIIDNLLLNTEELRIQAITKIWERLNGFCYYDCKITSYTGKPHLKRGNKILVEDSDGSYFETYVLSHLFKYDGTFYSEIESPSLNKEQTKIKNTNLSPKQRLINAEAKVLKNEGKIILLTEKTEEITSDIKDNYYTKTTTNELINDISKGLVNRYTVGGGNNLFRNTGLYFESINYSSGYDFWNGIVKKQDNNYSKSKTSMILQNGSVSQRQEVPNDIYTISFRYKRLNELANSKVKINDIEYLLEDNGVFTLNIEVQTTEIFIEFLCDCANGYEIYELMVNFGEIALTYSQNNNEIKTDTVEISEGIKITSTATDSIFRANADGIRTENKLGEVTTEFLDNGMKTTDLEADKGIVANLLITEVSGQVWLTGLGR